MQTLKKFIKYYKPYKAVFFIDLLCATIISAIDLAFPQRCKELWRMAILYDGQVKMANMAIVAGYSVNGVAKLHTEILKNQELHDFYEMFPEKFNNKTNGITQRRFLLHGNPLLQPEPNQKPSPFPAS